MKIIKKTLWGVGAMRPRPFYLSNAAESLLNKSEHSQRPEFLTLFTLSWLRNKAS